MIPKRVIRFRFIFSKKFADQFYKINSWNSWIIFFVTGEKPENHQKMKVHVKI